MTLQRRAYLRAAAGVGTAALAAAASTPPVAADHEREKPSHVSLEYSQTEVEYYRPVVDVPSRSIRPSRWYAWTARSPEYDWDIHVYWLFYQTQSAPVAAHRPDREPVYVYVDPEVGDVREVVYSAWHWNAYRWQSPRIYEPSDGSGRHVQLQADADYHHYYQTEAVGELFDVEPLGTMDGDAFSAEGESATTFEVWLANSWEDSLATGVVQHPGKMRFRESWWANGAERSHRLLWDIQLFVAQLGLNNDASKTDLA